MLTLLQTQDDDSMGLKHHHPERLDKIPDQCLHSTILYNPLTPICNEEARSFHVWELLSLTLLHPLYSSRTMTQLGSKHSNPILNTTPNYSLDKIPDRCLDSAIQSKPSLLPSATKRRCSFRKQFWKLSRWTPHQPTPLQFQDYDSMGSKNSKHILNTATPNHSTRFHINAYIPQSPSPKPCSSEF